MLGTKRQGQELQQAGCVRVAWVAGAHLLASSADAGHDVVAESCDVCECTLAEGVLAHGWRRRRASRSLQGRNSARVSDARANTLTHTPHATSPHSTPHTAL